MEKLMVIGASTIDVVGVSINEIIKSDSNVGTIQLTPGGVAKNIAENLHRLGLEPLFVTALGSDDFLPVLEKHFNTVGFDFHLSLRLKHSTALYLAIHDNQGELVEGINDFSILKYLDKNFLMSIESELRKCSTIVFDANLQEDAIEYLLTNFPNVSFFVDGVSQTKVLKLKPYLERINLLKLNKNELSALLGKPADDIILLVRELMNKGLKQVIVTNGKEPITYSISRSAYQTVVFETDNKKASVGCGDALFAGVIYGLLKGKSMHESVNYGKKAASITMEVYEPCNESLHPNMLED